MKIGAPGLNPLSGATESQFDKTIGLVLYPSPLQRHVTRAAGRRKMDVENKVICPFQTASSVDMSFDPVRLSGSVAPKLEYQVGAGLWRQDRWNLHPRFNLLLAFIHIQI